MTKIWISIFGALKKIQLKYQNAREKWMAKTPWQKWKFFYSLGKASSELIGIQVYSDMKNYWYTAIPGVCILMYFLLNFYTIQYYFHRMEFVRLIECIYLIGPIVGVSALFEIQLNSFSQLIILNH